MEKNPAWFRSLLGLVFFFVITWFAATAGILASIKAPIIYAEIKQPSWAPPSWLFGPVWSLLYCLMAIAAWLVWRQRDRANTTTCLRVYVLHLVFQGLWSWLFFAWGRADLAMIDILILWTMVAWMALAFRQFSRTAAWLMLPYLLWVSFATVLNGTLWYLNGPVLPQ